MKVATTQADLLEHISTNQGLPEAVALNTSSLESGLNAAAINLEATSGSYKFFGFLEVDYSFSITPPEVKIDLYITAFSQKVRIAGTDLNPHKPMVKIGGSALGFKAEVTTSFDFGNHILKLEATGCTPFTGCKTGSTQIHL